jgi:hypothetical protein
MNVKEHREVWGKGYQSGWSEALKQVKKLNISSSPESVIVLEYETFQELVER